MEGGDKTPRIVNVRTERGLRAGRHGLDDLTLWARSPIRVEPTRKQALRCVVW
jgi:hypothetical protein